MFEKILNLDVEMKVLGTKAYVAKNDIVEAVKDFKRKPFGEEKNGKKDREKKICSEGGSGKAVKRVEPKNSGSGKAVKRAEPKNSGSGKAVKRAEPKNSGSGKAVKRVGDK